jgi:cytochrome c-type biogenesis protein
LGLTFTALLDDGGAISDQYGVFTYPTTYFINAEGVVTAVHRGSLTEKYIEDYLADASN